VRVRRAGDSRRGLADLQRGLSGGARKQRSSAHKMKINVLFLCTGNSCRSQMAEGWARHLKAGQVEAYSAGIEKHGLNPYAVKVMAEAGVDVSGQYSKTPADIGPVEFDYVVTVCGHASEVCPVFPGIAKVVHVGFDDPPSLTRHLADGAEKLAVYRRVRDEIRRFVEGLPEALARAGERKDFR
jgi:arsenate reductase (thioredoxin)